MTQTLLLAFCHGFKGGDDAFHDFPKDIRKYVEDNTRPDDLHVHCAAYPVEESPGELVVSVKAFRNWLDNQVVEKEKETGPGSVLVVLIGHSTGGLILADALLSILDQKPVDDVSFEAQSSRPIILGVLTFDTPFAGLSRSMFAYGAFAQYRVVTNAYSQLSLVGQLVTFGSQTYSEVSRAKKEEKADAPEGWKAWQQAAMRTGVATSAAAVLDGIWNYSDTLSTGLSYLKTDSLSQGWSSLNRDNAVAAYQGINVDNMDKGLAYMSQENVGHGLAWISVHLQFAGALMRGEELTARLERSNAIDGLGFRNIYNSIPNDMWSGSYFVAERTFCSIPEEGTKARSCFQKEVSIKAKDEINAHINMLDPTKNPGYDGMTTMVGTYIIDWKSTFRGDYVDNFSQRPAINQTSAQGAQLHKYTFNERTGLREIKDTATGSSGGWLTSYLPGVPFYSSSTTGTPEVQTLNEHKTTDAIVGEQPIKSAESTHAFSSYLPSIPFYSSTTKSTSDKGSAGTKTTSTKDEAEPGAADSKTETTAANEAPDSSDTNNLQPAVNDDDELRYAVGTVDAAGNVIDDSGAVIGKVTTMFRKNISELEGKFVDEYGDIQDLEGNVLGKADPLDSTYVDEIDTRPGNKPDTTSHETASTKPKHANANPSDTQLPAAPPVSYARSLMRYFWSDSTGLREVKVPEKGPQADGQETSEHQKRGDEIEVDMTRARVPGVTEHLKVG